MTFIDSNIFMYASGKASPQRGPCQKFLKKLTRPQETQFSTDAEVLQEILRRYRAIKREADGFKIFDIILHLPLQILPVELDDLKRTRLILEEFPRLSTRDAVHLGVMQSHSIEKIVTYDKGFNKVPWVKATQP